MGTYHSIFLCLYTFILLINIFWPVHKILGPIEMAKSEGFGKSAQTLYCPVSTKLICMKAETKLYVCWIHQHVYKRHLRMQ